MAFYLGDTPVAGMGDGTTPPAATSVTTVGTSSAVGTSIYYARQDHVHGITKATITGALGYTPGTSNLVIGTAATNAASGNHTHSGYATTATVTTAANGLMSSSDKTKLNNLKLIASQSSEPSDSNVVIWIKTS